MTGTVAMTHFLLQTLPWWCLWLQTVALSLQQPAMLQQPVLPNSSPGLTVSRLSEVVESHAATLLKAWELHFKFLTTFRHSGSRVRWSRSTAF